MPVLVRSCGPERESWLASLNASSLSTLRQPQELAFQIMAVAANFRALPSRSHWVLRLKRRWLGHKTTVRFIHYKAIPSRVTVYETPASKIGDFHFTTIQSSLNRKRLRLPPPPPPPISISFQFHKIVKTSAVTLPLKLVKDVRYRPPGTKLNLLNNHQRSFLFTSNNHKSSAYSEGKHATTDNRKSNTPSFDPLSLYKLTS
ncbi:hypothetical protein Peur_033348 [Populus x canadensis]